MREVARGQQSIARPENKKDERQSLGRAGCLACLLLGSVRARLDFLGHDRDDAGPVRIADVVFRPVGDPARRARVLDGELVPTALIAETR